MPSISALVLDSHVTCTRITAAILGAPKEEQSGHLEIVTGDDQGSEYRLRVPYDSTILQG